MDDPLAWLDGVAEGRERDGLTRRLAERGEAPPGRLVEQRRTLWNFASNDYLGLAGDPRVIEAAGQAARRYGWGSGASPLVTGWRGPHQRLVEALADFERVEAVALFPTGFAANLGTIASLIGKGDAAYLDRLDHACLVAGARVSGASVRVYPHNDADRLGSILARERGRYRRALIATDGVFSMDGDVAPLAQFAEIAERHDAMLLVDEAHGTGVYGAGGRGASEEMGVADRIPIRVGTLSKALGSLGGFVAGSRRLIDHVQNHAPSFLYSTALPPAACAAAAEALRIARAEPWRRERCRAWGRLLREGLASIGHRAPPGDGPIVPIVVGDPGAALELSQRLLDRGFLVPAIRPPTVPSGTSRLRIVATAAHDEADIRALIGALA
ncbi:MAG: 8-amino-7-oxononanoate synthase [Isosphaeraceae bacterium]